MNILFSAGTTAKEMAYALDYWKFNYQFNDFAFVAKEVRKKHGISMSEHYLIMHGKCYVYVVSHDSLSLNFHNRTGFLAFYKKSQKERNEARNLINAEARKNFFLLKHSPQVEQSHFDDNLF